MSLPYLKNVSNAKYMKKIFKTLAVACVAVAIATACSSGNNTAENTETAITEPTAQKWDSLVALQDSKQQMSSKLFEGQNDELLAQILPDGFAEASINVFLLKGEKNIVLFDAGLGESRNGQTLAKLDSLGILPEQITDVCITHFHTDHIGGLLSSDSLATFPNAKLHFSEEEYKAWTDDKMKDQNQTVIKMLNAYNGKYEMFHAGDTIINDIVTIAAPGHTPGHTMYDIGDAIIVGDLLHAVALQVEHPEFSAIYDFDPEQAKQTRMAMLEIAKTSHKPLAGMHFPEPYMIKF